MHCSFTAGPRPTRSASWGERRVGVSRACAPSRAATASGAAPADLSGGAEVSIPRYASRSFFSVGWRIDPPPALLSRIDVDANLVIEGVAEGEVGAAAAVAIGAAGIGERRILWPWPLPAASDALIPTNR